MIEKNKGIDDYFLMADLINNLIIDRSKRYHYNWWIKKKKDEWILTLMGRII